jgi:hypothetical protein
MKAIKSKEIKFCPQCGSENIGVDADNRGTRDYCLDCGFNSRYSGGIEIYNFPVKGKSLKLNKMVKKIIK